ncbi:hypothetical protein G9A89_010499 [Geosiphon pyriformis]|nr:hypothetical protein G9A89_010499 [Geosiphon pyriformis]
MIKNNEYNGSTEYEKAICFLEMGCNCGCSKMIPRERFAELREAFQALSRSGQDILLMAQLRAMNGGEITANRNTPLCQKTYLNILGIGRTHFENVRNHLATNGIIPRVHGNVKKVPPPGRNDNRITQSLTLFPAETSYKSVNRNFIAGLENDIIPRTDLCDTCQRFRNGLQYNARKEEEAKDLLKKYKEYLVKAKLERNYYNKNTKLAEQQRKLVDEHFITRGKADYWSVNATAHYSYDWAQNVHVSHYDQQVIREQINYVLDEDEIIGKGPNGTLSMVFDGIKKLNKGEKHLKVTCDNAGGQNKNNVTI